MIVRNGLGYEIGWIDNALVYTEVTTGLRHLNQSNHRIGAVGRQSQTQFLLLCIQYIKGKFNIFCYLTFHFLVCYDIVSTVIIMEQKCLDIL